MSNWRLPFPKVADPFGSHSAERKAMGLGPHRGCDYNGFRAGTALPAVGDGVITLNKWSDVLGWVVVLKVDKYYWGYCHLNKQSPLKVGTAVKSGQSMGGAGTSGSASSGVHLHFTLSLLPEGVFAGRVYDAHAFLLKAIARQRPVTKPVAPAAVKLHCPTCKCKDIK